MFVHGEIAITGTTRVLAFSTTTPLGANAVYTSPTIDAINYKSYSGILVADQIGSYFVQHSEDGTTWYNGTTTAANQTANAVTPFANGVFYSRYFRFVYTNGATPQTSLHIVFSISPL
jgi:hypothetical protein